MDEGLELLIITGDDAAIEANVNPALALSGSELLLEVRDGGRGRDGIQWHVHDGSDTAESGGLSAGIEALPFGATWLIKVDVSVDQTREENMRRIILVRSPSREVGGGDHGVEDGRDLAGGTGDDDGGSSQTAGDDGTRRGHDGDVLRRNCLHGSGEQREGREVPCVSMGTRGKLIRIHPATRYDKGLRSATGRFQARDEGTDRDWQPRE